MFFNTRMWLICDVTMTKKKVISKNKNDTIQCMCLINGIYYQSNLIQFLELGKSFWENSIASLLDSR